MKKILIIGFTKISFMPYINFYLEALKGLPVQLHVISWNRDGLKDSPLKFPGAVHHQFAYKQMDDVHQVFKIFSFYKYREFASKIIRAEKFDFIVVLHTLPAVLITDLLLKHYRNKFILAYLDCTYEYCFIFKKIIEKLALASKAVFVSSEKFRDVLPPMKNIFNSHNMLTDSLNHIKKQYMKPVGSKPIRIVFWGLIRYKDINLQLINLLGNDSRFELHYYGKEQATAEALKSCVLSHDFSNIFFHGPYMPEDRYKITASADLINNLYPSDRATQRAISNKFYDSLIFKIPILCTKGSYVGFCASENGNGLMIDLNSKNIPDQIISFLKNLNPEKFVESCTRKLNIITEEYNKNQHILHNFFRLFLSERFIKDE